MPVSSPRLRTLSLLVALLLISTLASAPQTQGAPKSKKPAARTKAKTSKARTARTAKRKTSTSKAKKTSRVTAQRRTTKSKKASARSSKKKGRVYARGRSRRSRWKKQAAASVHGVGVHNYLTNVWTEQAGSSDKVAAGSAGPLTGSGETAAGSASQPPVTGLPAASPEAVTRPRLANVDDTGEPPLNPLVTAYSDSLAAFGYSADNQGFIVATLAGDILAEHNADRLFNPASVTKIATSLTAISRLGPEFKFRTALYTDGKLDPSTGILHGSLYVIGSGDPALFPENAMMIADKLNRNGIREVDGNLVVLGQFFFSFSTSREASAKAFRAVLTPETWSAQVKNSYQRFLAIRAAEERENSSRALSEQKAEPAPPASGPPSLKVTGQTITDPAVNTSQLSLLAVHTSLPLLRVLKGLNDFSNNWMASVIGNVVGGPDAVERFLKTEVGFKDDEVSFATSSGLGSNAISPRGTINMLRKLIAYLGGRGLGPEEILPVAGVDGGTLEKRFTDAFRGSVVAKTGTLSGVSALAGVAYTRLRGPLLFVIYNRGGSAYRFRAAQDETIKKLITLYGGPAPVRYAATPPARVSERTADREAQSHGSSNQR